VNKPLAFVSSCIALLGLIILGYSSYLTIVYGHGDIEAGNFHRCSYLVEHDAHGKVQRSYETRWELVSSTEASLIAPIINMWAIGIGLPFLGLALYVADSWKRTSRVSSV
jgi:hypothetical protein